MTDVPSDPAPDTKCPRYCPAGLILPSYYLIPHFTETGGHNTMTICVLLGPDTHQPPAIINITIKTPQQYTCSYHVADFPRSRHMLLTCSPPICWICTCYMLHVTTSTAQRFQRYLVSRYLRRYEKKQDSVTL